MYKFFLQSKEIVEKKYRIYASAVGTAVFRQFLEA